MAAPQPIRIKQGSLPLVDPLTGLATGSEFQRLLEIELSAPSLQPSERRMVAYLGLDRFRHLNNWLGFGAGDTALRLLAGRVTDALKTNTQNGTFCAARIGGDEFAFFAASGEGSSPSAISQSLLEAVRRPLVLDGRTVYLTASIGYRELGPAPCTAHPVLQDLSLAVSKAKERGGNCVERALGEDGAGAMPRYELEADLRAAVASGAFRLRFQPQVDRRCKLDGLEALLTWDHPLRGNVEPDLFIQVAEESGIIRELGEWVLRQGCLQIARWRAAGLNPPKLAINVSPVQFAAQDFVEQVERILKETGVSGDSLEFEITEHAILKEIEESAERMHRLRKLGISFAIDDFGVGYSPLTYLHRLPIDTVKVDRSFTGEIVKQGGSLALVHTITVLAHHRGLKVVAEGVETPGELEMIRAARCDRMQGYLFGSPVPADEIEVLLRGEGCLAPAGDTPEEDRLF